MSHMLRRRSGPQPPEKEAVAGWEDAKFAMQEFGNWIKNADTKVTVLAAALGVVITATASKADVFRGTLSNPHFSCKLVLIAALILWAAAAVTTAAFVYQALIPRTTSAESNRFAWPAIAAMPQPPADLDRRTVIEEAWRQNHTLAQIALCKYSAFKNALRAFGFVLGLSAAAIAIATWGGSAPT